MSLSTMKRTRRSTDDTLVGTPTSAPATICGFAGLPHPNRASYDNEYEAENVQGSPAKDLSLSLSEFCSFKKSKRQTPTRSDTGGTLIEIPEEKCLNTDTPSTDKHEDRACDDIVGSPVLPIMSPSSSFTETPESITYDREMLPSTAATTRATPKSKRWLGSKKSNPDAKHSAHSTEKASALFVARAAFRIGEATNLPYLKGVAGIASLILEYVEGIEENRENCLGIAKRVTYVIDLLSKCITDNSVPQLQSDIEMFQQSLIQVLQDVKLLGSRNRSYLHKLINQETDKEIILRCEKELDHAYNVFFLKCGLATQKTLSELTRSNHAAKQECDYAGLPCTVDSRSRKPPYGNQRKEERHADITDITVPSGVCVSCSTCAGDMIRFDIASDQVFSTMSPLPPSPKIFHGRQEEIGKLVGAVKGNTAAVRIAILGSGGIGKTALALTLLHHEDVADRFGARRAFISCDSANSLESLIATIAAYFGLPETQSQGASREKEIFALLSGYATHNLAHMSLADQVRSQIALQTIIILDNFESPWEPLSERREVEQFLSRLTDLENVSLIITMRGTERPKGVAWNRPFLPPLGTLHPNESKDLFRDISDAQYPNGYIHADDGEQDGLDELLDLCDNLPLAVELMANLAQPGLESVPVLLKRWKRERRSTKLLNQGESQRESLEVSIRLSLSSPRLAQKPDALALLSILSLLPDGLRNDELETAIPSIEDIEDCSLTLRRISLAYLDTNERLRVLCPIRSFVAAVHKANQVNITSLEAYLWQMLKFIKRAEQGDDEDEAVRRVLDEIGNIEALVERALRSSFDPSDAISAVVNLTRFKLQTGLGRTDLLDKALALSKSIQNKYLEAECLYVIGRTGCRFVDRKQKELPKADLLNAMRLYAEVGDRIGEADCMQQLSYLFHNTRQFEDCEASLKKAYEIYVEEKHWYGQASTLVLLGRVTDLLHDTQRAIEYAESALEILRLVLYSPMLEAQVLHLLGIFYLSSTHDFKMARELFEESLRIYEVLHLQKSGNYSNAVVSMGELALTLSKPDEAKMCFQRALVSYRRVQAKDREAWVLVNLGLAYVELKELDHAEKYLKSGLKLWQELGMKWGIGTTTRALGDLARARDMLSEAQTYYLQALSTFKEDASHWKEDEAECHFRLADICRRMDRGDDARKALKIALQLYKDTGRPLGEAKCLLSLGDMAFKYSDCDSESAREQLKKDALPYLLDAHKAYEKMGLTHKADTAALSLVNAYYLLGDERASREYRKRTLHLEL